MDKKTRTQLKAFLLSNQAGEDPGGYIAAMERISISHPAQWNGTLPPAGRFKINPNICKVIELSLIHISEPTRPY